MTLRGLIQKANESGVRRDDVVAVMKENEAFMLLYYKGLDLAEAGR